MGAGITDLGNIPDYLSQTGGAADIGANFLDLSGLPIPSPSDVEALINLFQGQNIPQDFLQLLAPGIGQILDVLGVFGGVPKGAKTEGAAQSLEASGNPFAADLGKAIQAFGGGQGDNVLSNPAFAHETNTFADALTFLTGKALPGFKTMGTTGEIAGIKPPSGAPFDKPVNIMGVQSPEQLAAQLGKSPNLSPAQIASIMPQLEALARTPGMSVAGLKSALAPLIKSASAVPPGDTTGTDINAYLNQGSGIRFPGLSSEGGGQGGGFRLNPLTLIGPLLDLFNFSGSNSDQQGNQQQSTNILNALGAPAGAAISYPAVAFPR